MTEGKRMEHDEQAVLSAEGVALSFGNTPALTNAGIDLRAGEIVALMGASGSGKSTFLHCLAGILRPSSGAVRYRGGELSGMSDVDRSALRLESFGFVFQFGQLVPELTVLENVALPLRLAGVNKRAAAERAADWVARAGVREVADHRPGEISGGQGQRAALARALVKQPEVLFADEPTGALDSVSGQEMMELLTDTARESGTSVVLVTHEPRVAAYADREVLLRDGRTLAEELV